MWKRYGGKIPKGRLELAYQWLEANANEPKRSFWIGKSLYCPEAIVNAAVLSAIQLAKEIQ